MIVHLIASAARDQPAVSGRCNADFIAVSLVPYYGPIRQIPYPEPGSIDHQLSAVAGNKYLSDGRVERNQVQLLTVGEPKRSHSAMPPRGEFRSVSWSQLSGHRVTVACGKGNGAIRCECNARKEGQRVDVLGALEVDTCQ